MSKEARRKASFFHLSVLAVKKKERETAGFRERKHDLRFLSNFEQEGKIRSPSFMNSDNFVALCVAHI